MAQPVLTPGTWYVLARIARPAGEPAKIGKYVSTSTSMGRVYHKFKGMKVVSDDRVVTPFERDERLFPDLSPAVFKVTALEGVEGEPSSIPDHVPLRGGKRKAKKTRRAKHRKVMTRRFRRERR
jgi:hypothetical protein